MLQEQINSVRERRDMLSDEIAAYEEYIKKNKEQLNVLNKTLKSLERYEEQLNSAQRQEELTRKEDADPNFLEQQTTESVRV